MCVSLSTDGMVDLCVYVDVDVVCCARCGAGAGAYGYICVGGGLGGMIYDIFSVHFFRVCCS